jgi:hypothetical protein
MTTAVGTADRVIAGEHKIHAMFFVVAQDSRELAGLAEMANTGRLRAVVSRAFPLAEGRHAFESGRDPRPPGKDGPGRPAVTVVEDRWPLGRRVKPRSVRKISKEIIPNGRCATALSQQLVSDYIGQRNVFRYEDMMLRIDLPGSDTEWVAVIDLDPGRFPPGRSPGLRVWLITTRGTSVAPLATRGRLRPGPTGAGHPSATTGRQGPQGLCRRSDGQERGARPGGRLSTRLLEGY